MLADFVWRLSYIVEHLLERLQQGILNMQAGKLYSSVIQGLVMGDDSQIGVEDW